jgi:DNA-binding NtrC family response regulator
VKDSSKSIIRVLVVDDDPSVRLLLGKFIELNGYLVETVGSGEEALELIQPHYFDIIFSDFQMYGMHGLDLAKEIRKFDLQVPIVIVSGVIHTLSDVDMIQYGVSKFCRKPFDLQEILEIIEELRVDLGL